MARKSKLNDEKHKIIVEAIRKGNFGSTAAGLAGISERSYWRYLQQGEEAASVIEKWEDRVEEWNELSDKARRANYHLKPQEKDQPTEDQWRKWRLWQDIKKAESQAEAKAVDIIHQIAEEGTFQAAAWYLERKFPKKWGRQDKSTVTYQGNIEHTHTLNSGPSEKEIEAAKQRLAEARQLSSGEDSTELTDFLNNSEVIDAEIVEED